jgi:hypothetical protein
MRLYTREREGGREKTYKRKKVRRKSKRKQKEGVSE